MKKIVWLIVLSLAANVVLAGIWLNKRAPEPATAVQAAETTSASAPAKGFFSKNKSSATATAAEAFTPAQIAKWKDLQRDDLKEFIRRLRAAGCPEETIQDIILAEVNRRYSAKIRTLWPERYEEKPFWKVEKQDFSSNKKNRENWRKERDLQKEKSALLVELLGVDPEKERRKEEGLDEQYNWWDRSTLSFIPEYKRDSVQKYLDEFNDKEQEVQQRNRGLWDSQSRAEQRELEAEKLKGLAQFLTPQELRDFELRNSQVASQLSHDLRSLTLDRQQYESIFDIRSKYGESIYNYSGDDNTKEQRDKAEENKKAMKAELVAALGPDTVKQYERSQDYYYQQLESLAKRTDLPAGTAGKVFDYKETAEQTIKQLNEDKTMTIQDRQLAAQKVREETEKAVRESLGEKNYKRYLQNGGWWLNSLAPAPPKPKPVVTP